MPVAEKFFSTHSQPYANTREGHCLLADSAVTKCGKGSGPQRHWMFAWILPPGVHARNIEACASHSTVSKLRDPVKLTPRQATASHVIRSLIARGVANRSLQQHDPVASSVNGFQINVRRRS